MLDGVKNAGKKVFKGFKTAGRVVIGAGTVTAEAIKNAKETIENINEEDIRNMVNKGRDRANDILDKLENKIMEKQINNISKEQKLQQEMDGRY